MFYVLNFKDHSFSSADYQQQVFDTVQDLLESGAAFDDDIEIVNAYDDWIRYSLDEFRRIFSETTAAGQTDRTEARNDA